MLTSNTDCLILENVVVLMVVVLMIATFVWALYHMGHYYSEYITQIIIKIQ